MRTLVVAGARPNFMKVAPILRTLRDRGEPAILLHTGQHYDYQMSAAFFEQLGIPEPDYHLGVGSGTHADQTARIMQAFEPVLTSTRPHWLVLVGDVNSTLACSLVAAKLKVDLGCQIAHVEAGLRSRDWAMPEEVNRVLTDRLSDLLFTTSPEAAENLEAEGIEGNRIVFAGNVMIDTLLRELPRARDKGTLERLGLHRGRYVVVTLHRPSNVDAAERLAGILRGLAKVADDVPVVLPLHPRTRDRAKTFELEPLLDGLIVTEPLGYHEMLALMDGAGGVFTDSGGIQEETTVLGVPCVTLRETTERPVTVEVGTNRMVTWPPTPENVIGAYTKLRGRSRLKVGEAAPEGWDGNASQRIVDALETARPRVGHQG
ncbi:MAG: UDP-N-acetylglucosamine 2-epimerase (non-hydrolyzing) [Gemmatimonadetes bacterium]|nr:UDP-N-acetylglucosamine 2-epimerase (non-hydrolyzing) [Gemmatimonadota bacterium]